MNRAMSDSHTSAKDGVEGATRRTFFTGAIYAMGAAIGAMLGAPALVYLFSGAKAAKPSEWVEAGTVDALAPGQPVEVVFRRNRVDGWKVVSERGSAWVVKGADNQITAFGPQCTHLGCAYHWDVPRSEFICPCHNSLFALDGKVVSGPAPRPLDRYGVKVDGNKLLLRPVSDSTEKSA